MSRRTWASPITSAMGAQVDELARKTGGRRRCTAARILRLLSAHGIFPGRRRHGDPQSRFRTRFEPTIRNRPGTSPECSACRSSWKTFEHFEHSVRTGRPAVEKAIPEGVWAWLAERPEASAVFNGAMIGKSFGQVAGSWSAPAMISRRSSRIADVGGGRGHLLLAILDNYPQATGLLFEHAARHR